MRKSIAATLAAAAAALPASAVMTPPDKFLINLPGTTAAQDPQLNANVIKDRVVPFAIPTAENVHGTVQIQTVRNKLGQLTFYWKINVAADAKGSVTILHAGGFPNHSYDADWRPDGLGTVAPTFVSGVVTSKTKQFDVHFQFNKRIFPGQSSRYFYLKTTATKSGPGFVVIGATNGGLVTLDADAPVF